MVIPLPKSQPIPIINHKNPSKFNKKNFFFWVSLDLWIQENELLNQTHFKNNSLPSPLRITKPQKKKIKKKKIQTLSYPPTPSSPSYEQYLIVDHMMVEISRTTKGFLNHRKGKSFFFRYFKFLLWISLSFYFLASFLVTHNPNLGVSNLNALPSSKALAEKSAVDFKLFVYDLPPEFNADWLSDGRCGRQLFASEVAIHRALLTSHVRTLDPFEANFFFLPVYVSCNFSSVNGFPVIAHARSLLASAVHVISGQYPFWNRSGGSDHVFVASHDYGACFHAMVKPRIREDAG